jgi:hypothetical protein
MEIGTSQGANQLNSGIDLLSLDMKYCVRREMGHCCMLYQVCNQYAGIDLTVIQQGGTVANGELGYISEGWSFHTFTKGACTALAFVVADNDVGWTDAACTTDYLDIPDSTTGVKSYGANIQHSSRYCGHRLGNIPAITATAGDNNHAPIWDCTEPFEATYHTDQMDDSHAQSITATPPNKINNLRGMCVDFRQDSC